MNLLVTADGRILLYAPKIVYGYFDEAFEKWALLDENDNVMMYAINHNYTVAEVDSLPEDYEDGKYFYRNNEFVLNKDWEPFIPEEKRVDVLERTVTDLQTEIADLVECQADTMYELSLMQLGMI
jgi:hypothetical protein